MNNWEKLKTYIDVAVKQKPHECGHGKLSGFREMKELMKLIENGEDEGIVMDNLTFKFEKTNASIVLGKDFKKED